MEQRVPVTRAENIAAMQAKGATLEQATTVQLMLDDHYEAGHDGKFVKCHRVLCQKRVAWLEANWADTP